MSDTEQRIAALTPDQRRLLLQQLKTRRSLPASGIQPVVRDGSRFPVSVAQERLWFLDQLSPGNAFYNLAFARKVGALDHRILERAMAALIERHEALRTTIEIVDHLPMQRVSPPVPMQIPFVDLSALGARHADAEAQRIAGELAQAPFELTEGPLLRAAHVRTEQRESVFIFVVHHLIADGWSLDLLFRELGELYAAGLSGQPAALTPNELHYIDYAVWQRRWLDGAAEGQFDYWRAQLASLPPLELPSDRPRPRIQSYRGQELEFRLTTDQVAALRLLAAEADATLFMLLLAACFILLHRYSGQDDFAIGTPVANRNRIEFEQMVGFFVNNLVVRADLSGNPSFRSLLAQVRQTAIDAYSNQDVPFSRLVTALKTERDLSRNPLFQVSFQLLASPLAQKDESADGGHDLFVPRSTAIFDLSFNLFDTGTDILGRIEYSTELFDRETIERMRTHFEVLLASISNGPDRPIEALGLLDGDELARLTVEWNDTTAPYVLDTCLHVLIEEQAARTPEAIAVAFGVRTLTYAELDRAADALAIRLQTYPADEFRTMGVLMRPCLELVIAILAVLKSGNAYVPLDPGSPRRRLAAMVADARPSCMLTTSDLTELADDLAAPVEVVGDLPGPEVPELENLASPPGNPRTTVTADDLAYVIFTSGSTGRPKGVMIRHASVVNYLRWCQETYPVDAGIGAPLVSPFTSDMSITSLFLPLITGKTLVLFEEEHILDALDEALRAGPAFSFVKLTPSHLRALRNLAIGRSTPAKTAAFIVGGEALLGETIAPWRDAAPDVMFYNEYGPTEATVGCSVYSVRAGDAIAGAVPIGRPIANTQLYVLDPAGAPAPTGAAGELYVGGAGLAVGYLGDRSPKAFVASRFGANGERLYRTGDLARYRGDGTLEYLGRIDRQVQIRGYRVEPAEVEAAIAELAEVALAVVTPQERIAGECRLVAFVVPAAGRDPETVSQRVIAQTRSVLPSHFVPAQIVIVDDIPLTASGKVDLSALEAQSLGTVERKVDFKVIAPRTALERLIGMVFSHVLGVSEVGVEHDFFAQLGGDSLLATQIVARLRQYLEVDLSLSAIFESPSVAELAAQIVEHNGQNELEEVAEISLEIFAMSDAEAHAQLELADSDSL